MPKLTIALTTEEFKALERVAHDQRRTCARQAEWLIVQGCKPSPFDKITPFDQLTFRGSTAGNLSGITGAIYRAPPPNTITGTMPPDWSEDLGETCT